MQMEELSPAKQRLLRLFQAINFGRVEELEIRDGEPKFSPAPRVFVELKLDANDGPRPESRLDRFPLRSQVERFFTQIARLNEGTIEVIEVRHGLRVGVRTREIFLARTPSRGTDTLSSEAAERETRLWREYPLDRLGLATSQGLPNPEGLALLAFVRGGGRLERRADDMAVLRLGRRLREWTGLAGEPFRYDESKAVWIACFECASRRS